MWGNTTSKNRARPSSVTSTWLRYYARINQAWTLSRLQIDTEVRERSADAVAEIKGAAIGEGGWATYGAIALIDAFFPEQVGSATYEELYEKRLRYLHDLAVPRNSLNINDQTRWRQLFPGEL
jgi:hypothetical protein